MFLGLNPEVAIITNIEHDHPDYYPTEADFFAAFTAFSKRVPPKGLLLYCVDDPGAVRLVQEISPAGCRVKGYGITPAGQPYLAQDIQPEVGGGVQFNAVCRGQVHEIALQIPGIHNVRNALATLAVADELALPIGEAVQALAEFRGTGRRFEVHPAAWGVTLIDDYAHHPTEIQATLSAARARYPEQRIWAVWQPHTYSRTRLLRSAFAHAFEAADKVVVTDIYAARESTPADGFSANQIVAEISQPEAHFIPRLDQAAKYLLKELQPGDVVLVLSAGDGDQINQKLLQALQERDPEGFDNGTTQVAHRF